MRSIKTFILRLYTDPEMPETICGDLQALPGRKTNPFKNYTELLNRLHQSTTEDTEVLSARDSQNENTNLPGLERPVK
jgi:hypothetical protein